MNQSQDPSQTPPPEGRPPGQAAGKWMLYVAWGLGMVLLTAFFGDWVEQRQNPNQMPHSEDLGQQQIVRLDQNFYGHYVANGKINGKTVTFMLDTGATDVVIPEEMANKIGLSKGMASQAYTANGVITVYHTRIDELQLGSIRLRNINASINPAMNQHDRVLMGMSALKKLEMQQEGKSLILRHFP